MKKMFNKAVLNGATVVGDGLTYPRIPNVYTGDNEGGYQRGDMMDVNAVVEMIKEFTDTGEITIDELQNLINEEIQERVEGDQDQQRYTDEKIKDLIGTSPETLDTLKEIADALGEDPDFAANVWEKLAEVDQTLEDYKRASNLPKYVMASGEDSELLPISFVQDANGIHLNVDRTDLDTGDVVSTKLSNAIPKATPYMPGLMSSYDKIKTDRIPQKLVTSVSVVQDDPSGIEIKHYGKTLNGDSWNGRTNIKPATSSLAGAMSASDKQKLDSLVNYQAGNGIDITGDTISCTLDTSLYSIVTELPETGLPNKIYLLPSTETEEGNIYTEYGYVDNKWEELGKYKADVDLSPYSKALNLSDYIMTDLNLQCYTEYITVYTDKLYLTNGQIRQSSFDIPKALNNRAGLMTAENYIKLGRIEERAQVNKIESISVNGTPLEITDKAVNIPNATTEQDGMMSKADKTKLDSLVGKCVDWSDDNAGLLPIYNGDGSDGEWIYTHWIGAGQGTDNTWRKASDIILENITSDAILNNTPIATTVKAGLMSASDKTKLNSPINYYYRNAGVDTKLTDSSTDNTCYIGSPVLEILGNKVEFKGAKLCTSNGMPYIDCSTSKAIASLLDGLMSKEDKAKLDSQPTIKANDATGVTDDDYVVIKKSEYQSILDRLNALEGNV